MSRAAGSPGVKGPAGPRASGLETDKREPEGQPTTEQGATIIAWHEFQPGDEPPARRRRYRRVAARTLSKGWGDSLFGLSAQAAFWCALSTGPMLLAMLGLTGLIAPLFGPDTLALLQVQIDKFLQGVFNPEVANNLVGDTVRTVLAAGRGDVVSVGLIVSLWAGSSAMSAFVEAITIAYRQHEFRNPAVERFFALGLYLIMLVFAIVLLPLLTIGPDYLTGLFPQEFRPTAATVISISYYPVTAILLTLALATLYKVAPKRRHPWLRGLPGAVLAAVVFLVTSAGLRLYLRYVYSHGLTYGALATPITFLLFYYFAAMAIILGAQFNNALLEHYPLVAVGAVKDQQSTDPPGTTERADSPEGRDPADPLRQGAGPAPDEANDQVAGGEARSGHDRTVQGTQEGPPGRGDAL